MQMSQHLQLQQTQKLIMTPELRQAITILQFSVPELEEYVEAQLLENPVLDVKEDENSEAEKTSKEEDTARIDWQEYLRLGIDGNVQPAMRSREEEYNYENIVTHSPTLHEHLMMQLHVSVASARDLRIGEHLLGNMDENGYLRDSIPDVASCLGVSEQEVGMVLKLIQTFEPSGVGARDLKECLLLQIDNLGLADPLARTIIRYHLPQLGNTALGKLAKQLSVSTAELQAAIDFIKTLNPKPGSGFGGEQSIGYILPDVVIEKVEHEYVVLVNEASIPRLSINSYYGTLVRGGLLDTDTKNYIEGKVHNAVWLIKSIEQRRQTLLKVVSCIAEIQRGFLDYGVKQLKPLALRQIAERIGMHESTVSRATNNKYVQTPRGLFPLRFFFSSGVEQSDGEGASAESIKQQIKELVQQEDSSKPYSDQAITDLIAAQDVRISRRTVAKYREELNIPSSNRRKRY